jgi:hypothetical protein
LSTKEVKEYGAEICSDQSPGISIPGSFRNPSEVVIGDIHFARKGDFFAAEVVGKGLSLYHGSYQTKQC